MKKITLVLLGMTFFALAANAQSKNAKGPIYISKDVQRIQYQEPVHPVKVVTGDVAWYSSKGVATVSSRAMTEPGKRVVVRQTPAWTISKGVARMQVERSTMR